MKTMTWHVIACLSTSQATTPHDNGESWLMMPRQPWEDLATHGKAILQEYYEFCSEVYGACSKVPEVVDTDSLAEVCNKATHSLQKEVIFLTKLGPGNMQLAENIKTLKANFTWYAIVKQTNCKAIISRPHLENFMKMLKVVQSNINLSRRELDSHITKSKAEREEMAGKLESIKMDEVFESLLSKFNIISNKLEHELRRQRSESYDKQTYTEGVREESIENQDLILGFNVLGAALVEALNLNNVRETVLFDPEQFDGILEMIKAYLGPKVLESCAQGLNLPEESVDEDNENLSDEATDDRYEKVFGDLNSLQENYFTANLLGLSPEVIESMLMNLEDLFPAISGNTTLENLRRVFMITFLENVIELREKLPRKMHFDTPVECDCGGEEYDKLLDKCSKKVDLRMRREYKRWIKKVKGMNHEASWGLDLLLGAVVAPNDDDMKNECRVYLINYINEVQEHLKKVVN